MFCTECGQPMADEAKFCALLRHAEIGSAPAERDCACSDAQVETPMLSPHRHPARAIRSTAEITPIRVQRPAPPPWPPIQPAAVCSSLDLAPAEERPAPQFAAPDPPAAVRDRTPAPLSHNSLRRNRMPRFPPRAFLPRAMRQFLLPLPRAPDDVEARRKASPVLIGAIVVALIAVAGIVWMVRSSMSFGGRPRPTSITIYPTAAKVVEGKGVDFVAEVSGAPSGEVTWSVDEGDSAGTVKSRERPPRMKRSRCTPPIRRREARNLSSGGDQYGRQKQVGHRRNHGYREVDLPAAS